MVNFYCPQVPLGGGPGCVCRKDDVKRDPNRTNSRILTENHRHCPLALGLGDKGVDRVGVVVPVPGPGTPEISRSIWCIWNDVWQSGTTKRASFSSRSGRLCRLCLVGNWRIVSYSVFFWSPATTHTHMHSLWSTGQCVCVCSCLRSAIRKPPDAGFGGSVNDCVCFRIHFFHDSGTGKFGATKSEAFCRHWHTEWVYYIPKAETVNARVQ